MRKRPQNPTSSDFPKELNDWAHQLQSAVTIDIEPSKVYAVAELASMTSLSASASLATTAGTTAGAITGAKSMTSVFAGTMAKIAASAAVAATVAGAGAITGTLPDPMQTSTANVAGQIGIDLPRPDIRVDVEGAGAIVLQMVDGVITVISLEGKAGWDAQVRSHTDTSLVVDYVSDTQTKSVTMAADSVGDISTKIDTAIHSRAATDLGTETQAEADSGSGIQAESDSSVDAKAADSSATIELETDLEIGSISND